MNWTDDAEAILRRMWGCGVSASKIAKHLGGVTRNAVVGKAHRLNLERRASPIKRLAPGEVPKRYRRANRGQAKGVRLSIIKSSAAPVVRRHAEPVKLHPTHKCKWLNGERPNWTYCGKDCQEGFSWCPEHKARVFQPKIQAAE